MVEKNGKETIVKTCCSYKGKTPQRCDQCQKCFKTRKTLLKHKRRSTKHNVTVSAKSKQTNNWAREETRFAIYVETNLFLIAFWYNTKWLTLERNFLCVHFVIRNLHSLVHYQDTREPTQEKRTINVWIVESGFKKSHLKLHQLIYSGEKPHACNSCDWTFSQSHNPKAHMKSHVDFAKHLFWV